MKDIEIIEKFIEKVNTLLNIDTEWYCQKNTDIHIFKNALENVLKEKDERIEKLEKEKEKYRKALGKRITYCNELEKDLFENCNKYVVPKSKIEELQEENKKKIIKLEPAKHISPFDYGVLNGIDEACRILKEDKTK